MQSWESVGRLSAAVGAHPTTQAVLTADRAWLSRLGSSDWVALVAECQRLVNAVSAVQAQAMARAAAYRSRWSEGGALTEEQGAIGTLPMDSGALVSDELATSDRHASRRVGESVEQVARLPLVTAAMADGRLDVFRAGVVTEELAEVPDEVADAVCRVLDEYFETETAGQLRRRVRSVLRRIDPSLVTERARRARRDRGARRGIASDGMDAWRVTFRTEESARAWAVVDARARELRAEGRPETLEELRADAILDLIEGRATIDVDLHVMVSLDDLMGEGGAPSGNDDDGGGSGRGGNGRGGNGSSGSIPGSGSGSGSGRGAEGHCAEAGSSPALGRVDEGVPVALPDVDAQAVTGVPGAGVPQGPASSREPLAAGSDQEAPRVAADDKMPANQSPVDDMAREAEAGISVLEAWLATLAPPPPERRQSLPWWWSSGPVDPDDLVEVTGLGFSGPVAVSKAWLLDVAAGFDLPGCLERARAVLRETLTVPRGERRARMQRRRRERLGARRAGVVVDPAVQACHPRTGALVDAADELGWSAYRPGPELVALVKARDGHCRFPGCTIHSRFCDLDHVRPWSEPEGECPQPGPTTDTNLICLCRRHHRVKQSPGWRVRLEPDGTATWVDPRGRARVSRPVDHLAVMARGLRMVPVTPVAFEAASVARRTAAERDDRDRRRLLDEWDFAHPFRPEHVETERMLRDTEALHARRRDSFAVPGSRPDATPLTCDILVHAGVDRRLNDPWGWATPPRRAPGSSGRWGDDFGDPPF